MRSTADLTSLSVAAVLTATGGVERHAARERGAAVRLSEDYRCAAMAGASASVEAPPAYLTFTSVRRFSFTFMNHGPVGRSFRVRSMSSHRLTRRTR
jgi:hypothetical protein